MLSGLLGPEFSPLGVVVRARVITASTTKTIVITKTSAFRLSITPRQQSLARINPVVHYPRAESGRVWVERPRSQTASRACSKSAMMSSTASIPTENRIIASVTPIRRLVSGSTLE